MDGKRQNSQDIGRGSPTPTEPTGGNQTNPDQINANNSYPTNKPTKNPKAGPEVNDWTVAP